MGILDDQYMRSFGGGMFEEGDAQILGLVGAYFAAELGRDFVIVSSSGVTIEQQPCIMYLYCCHI